jgi:hypothetical protein
MATPLIESYSFGRITVDGRPYLRDLIIYPDRVAEDWRRERGHTLSTADLEEVIEARPEVLVIGRGVFSRVKVSAEILKDLRAAGMEVIAEPTGAPRDLQPPAARRGTSSPVHLSC